MARDGLIMAGILLLAAVLRIVGLNAPLWYDEILTLTTHVRLPWGQMMDSYSMNHHYLYSFQAKAAVDSLGEAAWTLRLPAMLFGLGGIAATWALARMVAGSTVAHVTAALMALSFHHIWFSQNARGYTELAFWCALGLILFLRGLERPGPGVWLGFALTLALAIFTHLTGAFFFFALGLVWLGLLSVRRDRAIALWPLLGFVLGLAVTLALYAPVLDSLMGTVGGVQEGNTIDAVPQYRNPLWTVYEAVRTALGAGGALNVAVAAAVIALAGIGALTQPRPAPLLGLVVLVHIVVTMLLLKAIGMRIWPRFFFLDIGFLLILIVLGVQRAAGWIGGRRAGALFALVVAGMLVISAGMAARNYRFPKQNLEGAIAVAQQAARPGERTYAVGHTGTVYETYFDTGWSRIMTDDDYRAAIALPGPVTLVVGFPGRSFNAIPALGAARADGTLTELRWLPGTLGDGGVVVLQR
ncbi:MAG: glycosyltransferase family 39 protein [Roseivivax sp.]|nr:glycosyltransferase family 39 protein [Roseivivax sp.]